MRIKESIIEQYLCQQVKAHGGVAEKLIFMNKAGSPDRWCFFPNGYLFLVECKAVDGQPTPLQTATLTRFARMGFKGFIVYSKADVDDAVGDMLKAMNHEA